MASVPMVLVADADGDSRQLIACMLAANRFRPAEVASAEQAISVLKKSAAEVEVLVVDAALDALIDRVRNDARTRKLAVVVMAAEAEAAHAEADFVMRKPFAVERLVSLMVGITRGRAQRLA